MKILYLHQYFTTPDFSGGTRSYEFAKRLVQRGHEVTILTSSAFLGDQWAPTRKWNSHTFDGIQVEVIPSGYSNKMAHSGRMMEFAGFATRATIKGFSMAADVVFATSTPLTISVPGILIARRLGIPFVFEVRDLWPEVPIAIGALKNPLVRSIALRMESWAYRNAQHIIALSPDMKSGIQNKGISADKVSVIPNAADLDLFGEACHQSSNPREQYSWLKDRPFVIYAGTLGVINNVEVMVDMAATVWNLNPEIRFVVVGDGVRREAVEKKALDAGVLNRNFFILPPLPKKDVARYIAEADLSLSLVAPIKALWANSANKVFDAMAAGTAVAINHGGWMAHVLTSSGAGLVLSHDDPASAGGQIAEALDHDPRLVSFGRKAANLAREKFDREILTTQLENILQKAVFDE